ncbi:MAG: nucleoside 2-deoxyribosyltransferase [archaeon]
MKIFITYKFVGENPEELERTLTEISDTLEKSGHEVYSAFTDEELFVKNNFSLKQILNHALNKIDLCECVLVFVRSPEKTEGMLIEIGYALAKKKKIILATRKGAYFQFTQEISDQVIEYETLEELKEKLGELK